MELVVATRNAGKLREIRHLLEGQGISVIGLDSFPEAPEVEEDGETFAANAVKKALAMARFTNSPCLADDSGLVVAALDGRPGVHSARYAGAGATDHDNNCRLLKEMADIPAARRQAAFCCVMALCLQGEPPHLFEGRVEGMILDREKGDGGFGYDPLFWLPEFSCTMAELPLTTKNHISHRGQALRLVAGYLRSVRHN
jgi:XTP/dITP diphosphohydrolase